jgi:Tol biopolymer transport system component
VLRVPIDGGEPETLSTWSGSGRSTSISPDARYVYRKAAEPSGKPPIWELATVDGRALARFTLPENMAPSGFGPGEGELITVLTNIAAPLRILPVNGGPTRQLTETRAYDVPLRWTSGGREVFFQTELNGQRVYMLAPLDGSAMRQVPLPEPKWGKSMPQLSGDTRHVLWVAGKDASLPPVLKLLSVEDNRTEVITESPCGLGGFRPTGDGEEYVYCTERDGRNEYRASRVDGPSRLVRSFPKSTGPWAAPSPDVHGDRITYVENTGQDGALYVALAGQEEARRVVAREGRIGTRGMQGPVWSPDGRLVVVGYAAPDADDLAALIVEVSNDGERVAEPRILDIEPGPDWWWDLQWLPDSRGFLILGMGSDTTVDTDIWLVSLDPNDDPVKLTADDPSSVWSFALSPNGRHIAYSSDVVLGSSFWRVDLSDALGAEGR